MSEHNLMHAVHQITDYEDNYMESNYDSNEDNFLFTSNKKRRKTTTPQKKYLNNSKCNNLSQYLSTSTAYEPINLVTKNNFLSSVSHKNTGCNFENELENFKNNAAEQLKLYATMLNYFLLKHKYPNDKCFDNVTNNFFIDNYLTNNKCTNNSLFNNSLFVPSTTLTTQNSQVNTSLNAINGSHTNDAFGLFYSNNFNFKNYKSKINFSLNNFNNIFNLLNSCIANIPQPQPGYLNLEALVLCYKNIVEKASNLQQLIDLYLNMIQNCISFESCLFQNKNENTLNLSNQLNLYEQSSSSNQSLTNIVSFSNTNISENFNNLICSNETTVLEKQNQINKKKSDFLLNYQNHVLNNFELNNHLNTNLQSPVDLTNNDKWNLLETDLFKNTCLKNTMLQNVDKSNKENSFNYTLNTNLKNVKNDLKTNKKCLSKENLSETKYLTSKNYDSTFLSNTKNNIVSQINNNSFTCNSSVNYNQKNNILTRKKSYFKNKKTKKSYSINLTSNNLILNNDLCLPKKTNFRGTSEEENKVASNFKPTEINVSFIII